MATILVADEDGRTRLSVQALLSGLGHEVLQTSDGESARTICERSMPNVVIADLSVRLLSGLTLVEHLAAANAGSRTIATSASAPSEKELREKHLGVGAMVRKPIDEEILLTEVHKVLKHSPGPS